MVGHDCDGILCRTCEERREQREYREASAEIFSEALDRIKNTFTHAERRLLPDLDDARKAAHNGLNELIRAVIDLRTLDPDQDEPEPVDAAAAKGEYMANVLGPER